MHFNFRQRLPKRSNYNGSYLDSQPMKIAVFDKLTLFGGYWGGKCNVVDTTVDTWRNQLIHPFDNYVIWPGSLALMNREPITLRYLLMRARLQDQKDCVT